MRQHTEELIELSNRANDMYCKLGEELEYWKERCRLTEEKFDVISESFQGIVSSYDVYEN